MSYPPSTPATGPQVYGIYEGRTPCQGIARELKVSVSAASTKLKWRITLFQDPTTRKPTTYKVEGALFGKTSREGEWSIIQGTAPAPDATILRLAPLKGEPPLFLLKGDENVLFFLDGKQEPLVGHCEFSYTLNRRK